MTQELQKELDAYKRALTREKQARAQAETQLENYSREIYQSKLLLDEQTHQLQSKQKHLAFLISVAEDNWHFASVSEVVEQYLQKSCVFLKRPFAAFIQVENEQEITRLQIANQLASPLDEYIESQETEKILSKDEVNNIFQQLDLTKLKREFIEHNKGALFDTRAYCKSDSLISEHYHIYLMPMFHSQNKNVNKFNFMCFFYQKYDEVNLLKLETMEASHSIFNVAIERKKAEVALKSKLQELQQSNDDLQQIQLQLIESEKLASLGQLSAGIAHEINNPVGFVLSNLSVMSEYIDDFSAALEPLNQDGGEAQNILSQWHKLSEQYEIDFLLNDTKGILQSSLKGLERVKDIIADLSSFSRMDSDELVPVNMDAVIHSALNIINNELKYKHTVELDIESDLEVLGNEGQLQQVFINFFVNAKHAMPDGGCLAISCKKIRERVVVTIKDHGHGIKPENLKNIFTPFFTTKPPGEGTGLGLSISYSILQRHHAKIKVDSVVDEGTEFTLSFIPVS